MKTVLILTAITLTANAYDYNAVTQEVNRYVATTYNPTPQAAMPYEGGM